MQLPIRKSCVYVYIETWKSNKTLYKSTNIVQNLRTSRGIPFCHFLVNNVWLCRIENVNPLFNLFLGSWKCSVFDDVSLYWFKHGIFEGFGAEKSNEDNWLSHQLAFDDLLSQLNQHSENETGRLLMSMVSWVQNNVAICCQTFPILPRTVKGLSKEMSRDVNSDKWLYQLIYSNYVDRLREN